MKIGKWGGINVYIHWTFWLLIAFYLISVTGDQGLAAGLLAVAFVLSVFACVALHEFGHAGAAAYYGIRTLDITLLPIGGVARLEQLPEKPYQELVIAVAGPAVNFVIVGALLPLTLLGHLRGVETTPAVGELGFVGQLLAANLILAIFNLLPAFPMDGGRVLRSLLAMRMGHLRATEIAARAGRWMALFFGLVGIVYFQFTLVLLALFIFLAGTAELMAARVRAMGQELQGRGFAGPQGFSGPQGFAQWQVRSWPTQYGPAEHNTWPAAGNPHYEEPRIIDATEVRRLPNEPPAEHDRL
jgi:Zn-dependent protease